MSFVAKRCRVLLQDPEDEFSAVDFAEALADIKTSLEGFSSAIGKFKVCERPSWLCDIWRQ